MADVNLYDIYSRVCNRKNRGSIEPGARLAAYAAADKAHEFINQPNATTLASFREAERLWAKAAGGDKNKKAYADDFEACLRSGKYHVRRTGVNSAWNKTYQPPEGFIYGATSIDRPGWMKLGATTDSPVDRLAAFAKKYGLRPLALIYHARVAHQFKVENEIRKVLLSRQVRLSANDSREWFEVDPRHAMQTAIDAVARLGVKVFTPVVPSRTMKAEMETATSSRVGFSPVISYGGRRAGPIPNQADWSSMANLQEDLQSKVAGAKWGFRVGSRVVHKAKGKGFGTGVIVELNNENLTVHFQSGPKPFVTKTAANYLTIVSN